MCDRVVNDCCRHVARAIPDCRAVAGDEEPAVHVELVSAAARGDHHYDRNVCGNDAAVHAVLEGGADHFDLGTKGRRTRWAAPHRGRGRREESAVEGASVKAIYGLYSDPDSAQHAVDELRRAGVADRAS